RDAFALVGAADEAGAGALDRRELGACLPAGATRGSRPPPPAARARTVARPGVARLPIVPGGVFVDRALADAAQPRDLGDRHGGALVQRAHARGQLSCPAHSLFPSPRTICSLPRLRGRVREGASCAGGSRLRGNPLAIIRARLRAPRAAG